MNVNKILKPKTQNDIEKSICDLYGLNLNDKSEIQAVLNIHNMVTIKISPLPVGTLYFFTWEEEIRENVRIEGEEADIMRRYIIMDDASVAVEDGGLDVEFNTIKTTLHSKNFQMNTDIKKWKSIYNKVYRIILKNAVTHQKIIQNEGQIFHYIHMMSNLIYHQTRKGSGNFVIMSKKMIDRLPLLNFHVIIDERLDNKIIIGRKGVEMETNLYLLKHENKYKLAIPKSTELKNYYICLECTYEHTEKHIENVGD